MPNLSKPKNCWCKVLFILHDSYMGGTNMMKVLTKYDPTFYKFQARLLEIENRHPKLKISRTIHKFRSKMTDSPGYYTQYTPLSPKPYIINLYNKLNRDGMKKPK